MLADAKENMVKDSELVQKKAKTTIAVDSSSSSSESESESESTPELNETTGNDTCPPPSQGALRPRAQPLRNPL